MKYEFTITDSTGRKTTIVEAQRQKAIETYLKNTGMPEDFFKKHCTIKNNGRIE